MKKYLLIVLLLSLSVCCFGQEKTDSNPVNDNGTKTSSVSSNSSDTNESAGSQKVLYTEEQKKLRITAKDIRLVPEPAETGKGGFHLYVKKVPNINSILLTETTKDPNGKNDSYAYRAKEYNEINGDEIRYLDGKPLISAGAKYSLVDSTPEPDEKFGMAFHIYIPQTLVYGYEWARKGEIEIGKGTFINVRTFEKPYADYSGAFMDSPFMFNLEKRIKKTLVPKPKKEPEPIEEPEVFEETVLTDLYNPIAHEKLKEISKQITYSKGPETIVKDISGIIEGIPKKDLDLVLAIDATGSMKNDIDKLKEDLRGAMEKCFKEFKSVRVGLLFYRDYGDTFKYDGLPVRFYPFTSDLAVFNKNLNSVKIIGTEGGDIPEAVYEAIYASAKYYTWREDVIRQIILIGDAEPHPTPRGTGKYSKTYVMDIIDSKNIQLETILLPDDK